MRRWLCGSLALLSLFATVVAETPPTYVFHFGRTGSSPGLLKAPFGVCTDGEGFVYVAELLGNRIQKWTTAGVYVDRWGGEGQEPGLFLHPADVVVDGERRLWVADRGNHRLQCFDRDGHHLATYGAPGRELGQFLSPSGLCYRDGHLYVADSYNNRVQKLALVGLQLTPVLAYGDSGSSEGKLLEPQDVDVTPNGEVVISDAGNNRVQIFHPDGRLRLAFGGLLTRSPGRLSYPYGVSVDALGNIYVSEPYRRRVQKYDTHGCILTSWGPESTVKVEHFSHPLHMWIDSAGLLYVADYDDASHSDRIVVWRPADAPTAVTPSTWTDVRRAYR